MNFANISEVQRFCQENGILAVDFKVSDLDGRIRHLTIPLRKLTDSVMKSGISFDSSSYGLSTIEDSDMVFIPDLATAFVDPFLEVPTLSFLCNMMAVTGGVRPYSNDPRRITARAEQYLVESGIADRAVFGPEYEFYVFNGVGFGTEPGRSYYEVESLSAHWDGNEMPSSGFVVGKQQGYHVSPPRDLLANFRTQVTLMLEEASVPVKYHHHEVGGAGQQEIEVELASPLKQADATQIVKYFVKNQAALSGLSATFMPKPIYGEAGSGMHVHMQLFKAGEPVFYDAHGYSGLSNAALQFIAGVLAHSPALLGLTNPSTNSYKRLVPGYEAPVSICFATANRSSVIRIPGYAVEPEKKRFEFRPSDATCNPYLAMAALLMAGLDGIKRKLDPTALGFGPLDKNLYELPLEEAAKIKGLPRNLDEALDALAADHSFLTAGGVFTEELISMWIERKRAEGKAVSIYPSPAEYVRYFDL